MSKYSVISFTRFLLTTYFSRSQSCRFLSFYLDTGISPVYILFLGSYCLLHLIYDYTQLFPGSKENATAE